MKFIKRLFNVPTIETIQYTEIPYKDWKDSRLDILGGQIVFKIQGCFIYRYDDVVIGVFATINTNKENEYAVWEEKLSEVGFKKAGSPYSKNAYSKDIEVSEFSKMIKELEAEQ